mgnify:CR=1 FL=1
MVWDLPVEEVVFVLETGVCPIISVAERPSKQIIPKEMTNFFIAVVFYWLNNDH